MNVDFIAGLSDIPVAAPALVFHVIIYRPAVDGVASQRVKELVSRLAHLGREIGLQPW